MDNGVSNIMLTTKNGMMRLILTWQPRCLCIRTPRVSVRARLGEPSLSVVRKRNTWVRVHGGRLVGNNNGVVRRLNAAMADQSAHQMERFAGDVASMNADAESRFERTPLPMAFPKDMEPPRTFHLSWTPQPVPLKAEERVASLVVKRGDFGWLSDERVDAIAAQVESEQMNLDQALSLRSALLQQKTVYSHHRLKSKAANLPDSTERVPRWSNFPRNTISHRSTFSVLCLKRWDGRKSGSRKVCETPHP